MLPSSVIVRNSKQQAPYLSPPKVPLSQSPVRSNRHDPPNDHPHGDLEISIMTTNRTSLIRCCRRHKAHVPYKYGVLLLSLCAWAAWTIFREVPVLLPAGNVMIDEPVFHRPPKTLEQQSPKSPEESQADVLRQHRYELIQHHLDGASEGLKTVGHFKTKSLLGKHRPSGVRGSSFILTAPSRTNYTVHYRPTIPPPKHKYGKILYFVHIHKSAGSLFCRLAFKNRVNSNQGANCNVQDDQYCCGGKDTMQAQIQFANKTYWDLVATERELYDSLAPEYYDYIVTLRDSKQRYYSHWSHLRRMVPAGPGIQRGGFGDSAWIFGNNTSVNRRIKEAPIPAGVDPLGNFETWFQGQPDNWNTRILCGAKCRICAKYRITRELFDYTIQRADKFAHFLFVEDMEASYNQLAQGYQWRNYSEVASEYILEHRSNRRKDKDFVLSKLAKEPWDPLMSALDDALYEFAQRKYHHVPKDELWKPFRNQETVDRYFAEGFQRGCINACCGNCSSY